MVQRRLIYVIIVYALCLPAPSMVADSSRESVSNTVQQAIQRYLAELEEIDRAAERKRAEARARLEDALASISETIEEQPRKLPVYVQAEAEESRTGIVTVTQGRVVVLEDDEWFSINKDTQYFKVTPFDLVEVAADSVRPGVPVTAVGKPDVDGEFVAHKVLVLPYLPKARKESLSGPDRMEWVTDGIVEGVDKEWILLNKRRKIPVSRQTKFYVTRGGRNEPAELDAVKVGAVIEFNLSGRPAVLKGQESGDVTTVWVVVREQR